MTKTIQAEVLAYRVWEIPDKLDYVIADLRSRGGDMATFRATIRREEAGYLIHAWCERRA